ncbi:uncharacterized protein DNG_08598 [Cephalotrichum gorgonifer]|uniref:Uncharacterized protein n=1 Tax=Cephalotrichum gorgonifer TaxID=2041049 RepID=A0AAE8SYI6_9PEZI|nr:uncharacterized protein DNG_08598 [Cephalotrichum gorgonifer]
MFKSKSAEKRGLSQGDPSEKPLPNPRPGTAGTTATGTLTALTSTRLQAAKSLRTARRAERTYRTKKHAAAARRDIGTARGHYKEGVRHLWLGLKFTFGAVRMAPAVAGEKVDGAKGWWGEKKKAKAVERRKALEKKLAKEKGEEDDEEEEKKEAEGSK